MSVNNAIRTAVFSKLAAGSALISALGGTLIYYDRAPDDSALPYVVFSFESGGPENLNPSDMRAANVRVIAYSSSPGQAGTLDSLCSALIHRTTLTVSGYTNFWTAREGDISFSVVEPSGLITWQAGGVYRVRIDQ